MGIWNNGTGEYGKGWHSSGVEVEIDLDITIPFLLSLWTLHSHPSLGPLTSPRYLGVYPLTQGQWAVKGQVWQTAPLVDNYVCSPVLAMLLCR